MSSYDPYDRALMKNDLKGKPTRPLSILYSWDFTSTSWEKDGYDLKEIPDNTNENFNILLERVNELTIIVNKLCNEKMDKPH